MKEEYIKWQIESVVNKLLYQKGVVEKEMYEQVDDKIDTLLFQEKKKNKKE